MADAEMNQLQNWASQSQFNRDKALTRAHEPILDLQVQQYLDKIFSDLTWNQVKNLRYQDYDLSWRQWLKNSSYNMIPDLDSMPYSCFCPGTTPAFGSFVARHHDRRVRVSSADFMITGVLAKNYRVNCVHLEDEPLNTNDCMVISLPFSGNGSTHLQTMQWLTQASELAVPVMIDGAYFGISHGIQYPLHLSCVEEFAVSLSKNYVGKTLRLGIRFSRNIIDDSLSVAQIGSDIFDRMGATVAIRLLEQFPHDWFINAHLEKSIQMCNELGLTPTNTMTLAIGGPEFIDFERGNVNRVCISSML